MHFDPSSRRLVGSSFDGTARVWMINSPYRVWSSPELGTDCGTSVSLEPDRRVVAVGCHHETRVWDSASDKLLATLPGISLDEAVVLPAVSATGDLTAIARGNRIEVYEAAGGKLRRTIQHASRITTVRFASNGHSLVAGSEDGTLLVVPEADAEAVRMSVGKAAVDVAAFLPGGRVVAVDADRRLVVLDVKRRELVSEVVAPSRVGALRVSSDGHRLITIPVINLPQPPVLWDLERMRLLALLEGHGSQVYNARFVRDDHEILTAGTDGTARLWDNATGRLRQTFFARSTLLIDAAMSPDGSMVVAGDTDGMLRFWDAASGAALWTLRAHKTLINGVHFDGDSLVSRGGRGELTRWLISRPSAVGSSIERFSRLVACGPLRFDEASGSVVSQSPACDGPQP